jgi:hypothetical protein
MILGSGCALWKDLNTPVRKTRKPRTVTKPKVYEPEILPDGTTAGLNSYEKRYMEGLNKNFKRRERLNAKKVFGISRD